MSFIDNIRHHVQVAREAYAQEKEAKALAGETRKKRDEELAFMPAALEITETPASPIGRAISLSICAFFVIAVVWGESQVGRYLSRTRPHRRRGG